MRTPRSLLLVLPLALVATAGMGAAPGCYGPTEISVAVTTTVACSPTLVMTTQIFTGPTDTADFGTAPAAETAECGPAEPRVGTLAIVPSGSRDDRFDLEVVGAVGVPTSACRDASLGRNPAAPGTLVAATTTGCVVAKRRVSFRPHKSLTIPVLLSARCIGVPCGVDQTCDLGVCTATADCTDEGCPRERAQVAGPVDDAATDAGGADVTVDAPFDVDASKPRCTTTPEVVIAGESILGPLVKQGPDFVYLNGTDPGTVHEIHRVPRAGAATPQILAPIVPVGTQFLASLAATSTSLAWFDQGTDATAALSVDGGAAHQATHPIPPHDHTSLAFSTTMPDLMVGFWRASGVPFAFTLKWPATGGGTFFDPPDVPTVPGDVSKVLVDDTGDFYGIAADTLLHYGVNGSTFTPTETGRIAQSLGTLMTDFAVVGQTVYVAAAARMAPTKAAGIYQIPRDSIVDPFPADAWIKSSPPQSMTTDGTWLFYLVGTALWRVNLASAPAMSPVPEHFGDTAPNMTASRLQVDDQCIYWVQGDTTIMKRSK